MKPYFAYIRVSTVRQGEEGSSLAEQRFAIEAFAARNGIVITEWFEEMETAAKRGRPQFSRLTELLRKGKATGVILHKIDRGARNLKDWADLGELIDAGIEILFAHEGLDMTTRGGRLAADIQAVVAADYIRNLRDEVLKGFYGRLKQGLYPLPAPRGYLDNGKGRAKTIDPIAGPIVRRAFERYETGTVSLESLRHELVAEGLTGAGGKPLSLDAIALLLHNPFYTGLIRIGTTGEIFEGIHEPLVSKKTFDRVQAIMEGRCYPRVEIHTHLFRRMVKCSACGRSLTAETQKGHIYYRCHGRGCRKVSLTESSIETFVAGELAKLALTPRELGDLRDLFQARVEQEKGETHIHLARCERDLALVAQRLERLTDALIDGTVDPVTFNERKATLLADKVRLRDNLAKGGGSTFWQDVVERFERGITAQLSYISGNPEEKREALKIFGSNLIVTGKSLVFPMHFVFDELRKWSNFDDGGPYQGAVRTKGRSAGLIKAIEHHQNHDHLIDAGCINGARSSPSSPSSDHNIRTRAAHGAVRALRSGLTLSVEPPAGASPQRTLTDRRHRYE